MLGIATSCSVAVVLPDDDDDDAARVSEDTTSLFYTRTASLFDTSHQRRVQMHRHVHADTKRVETPRPPSSPSFSLLFTLTRRDATRDLLTCMKPRYHRYQMRHTRCCLSLSFCSPLSSFIIRPSCLFVYTTPAFPAPPPAPLTVTAPENAHLLRQYRFMV